jgi:hypothetical protein
MATSGSLDNTEMLFIAFVVVVLYEEVPLRQKQLILGFRSRTSTTITKQIREIRHAHLWVQEVIPEDTCLTELLVFQTYEWRLTRIKSDIITAIKGDIGTEQGTQVLLRMLTCF